MKAFYYYERDAVNRPIYTHCFLTDGKGTYSRGSASCSPNDNPCKFIGRRLAYGRAMKAFYCQKNTWMTDGYCRHLLQMSFMPALRQIEIKFLDTMKYN